MKAKRIIEEAVVDFVDEETPMTYDELLINITNSVSILKEETWHFTALSLEDKKRFYKIFKRSNLQPMLAMDYEWLCEYMKEDIDECEGTETGIVKTPRVISEGRGNKKVIDYVQVEELAATLATKTAVAQGLGFYGAPGFNNRFNSDPEFKAAYDKGIARRAA